MARAKINVHGDETPQAEADRVKAEKEAKATRLKLTVKAIKDLKAAVAKLESVAGVTNGRQGRLPSAVAGEMDLAITTLAGIRPSGDGGSESD